MPSHAETTERAFRAWVRTSVLFRHEMESYFQRHGLSGAQWGVLRNLHRSETAGLHGITLGDLAKRMFVKPPSITGVIDRLERQGFVERTPSLTDLRSKQVGLTPAGRAVLDGMLKHHPAQMDKVLGGLTMPQRTELFELLSKVENHLEILSQQPSKVKIQ